MSELLAASDDTNERIEKLQRQNIELRTTTAELATEQLELISMLMALVRARNLDQEIVVGGNRAAFTPTKRLDELWDRAFSVASKLHPMP